jgi:hypothetical protein
MKRIEIVISLEEYAIIKEATQKALNDKKRKNYGVGSYLKESGLNRAKRLK